MIETRYCLCLVVLYLCLVSILIGWYMQLTLNFNYILLNLGSLLHSLCGNIRLKG